MFALGCAQDLLHGFPCALRSDGPENIRFFGHHIFLVVGFNSAKVGVAQLLRCAHFAVHACMIGGVRVSQAISRETMYTGVPPKRRKHMGPVTGLYFPCALMFWNQRKPQNSTC